MKVWNKFGNPALAKRATVVFLAFLMFVGLVYASLGIWSNIVNVTVTGYINHLYQPDNIELGKSITFKGYVIYTNGTPINGIEVQLYYEDETYAGNSTITSGNGNYTILFKPSSNGTFSFKTYAKVIP